MNNSTSRYTNKDVAHKFDFQSRLGYSIQGKRGGTPQVKDDVGCICTFIDNSNGCQYEGSDSIRVDAFQGYGETYGRREKCEITICNEGKEIFKGNFNELVNKLSTVEHKSYTIEPIE